MPAEGEFLGGQVGVAFLFWQEFWADVSEPTSRTEIPTYLTKAVKHKQFKK